MERANIRAMMRGFNKKVKEKTPESDLALALAATQLQDDLRERDKDSLLSRWQDLWTADKDSMIFENTDKGRLEKSSRELAVKWQKFQKHLPGEQPPGPSKPPKLSDLMNMVEKDTKKRNEKRNSKTGKWKERFFVGCKILQDHESLFALIPEGDKYTSLLTGSISAVVKAAVNHEEIAEGISKMIADLGDDIPYLTKLCDRNRDNATMERYMQRIYLIIFSFFINIMTEWSGGSSAHRLWKSFDSGFVESSLEDYRTALDVLTGKMARENDFQNTTRDDLERSRELMSADFSAQLARLRDNTRRDFMQDAKAVLDSFAFQMRYLRPVGMNMEATNIATIENVTSLDANDTVAGATIGCCAADVEPKTVAVTYSGERIRRTLSGLKDEDQDRVFLELSQQSDQLRLNPELCMEIQDWFSETESCSLWIAGPSMAPRPSHNTLLSAYVTTTAKRMGIPVIAYIYEPDDEGEVEQPQAIIRMVYSLIYQTGQHFSTHFESDRDLSDARFRKLDGRLDSIPEGIRLLADMIQAGPRILFCLIDGIEHLADFQSMIGELVKAVQPSKKGAAMVVKTLLTTDGFSDVLDAEAVDRQIDGLCVPRRNEHGFLAEGGETELERFLV